jgi:hypothetical protein
MYPQKVKRIVTDAPFHTVEGIPYGKKTVNFNQPLSFVASDIARYFNGNLYGYEFDEEKNSMLVILTNARRIRIDFKEQRHDTEKQAQQQEQEHIRRGHSCQQEKDTTTEDC